MEKADDVMDSAVTQFGTSSEAASMLRSLHRDLSRVLPQMAEAPTRNQADKWLQSINALLNLRQLDQQMIHSAIHELVRICTRGGQQFLLSSYGITYPPYNYFEDFSANASGPWDVPPTDAFATPARWHVLGHSVGFPVGLPASSLTVSANWVEYFARRGFNIITFKTMRSREWAALPEPNWVFLRNLNEPIKPGSGVTAVGDEDAWPEDSNSFSMANSFGVPSFSPERWQAEVASALERISSSQLLIVSVMGSAEIYKDRDLIDDYCKVSLLAEEAGATAIELNLSCPNTIGPNENHQHLIAESPATAEQLVKAVREELRNTDTRIAIKLNYLAEPLLEEIITRTAPFIDGISGINTLQTEVRRPDQSPTFPAPTDPSRSRMAGVSGIALREYALDFIRNARSILDRHGLELDLIGMGGVMTPQDFDDYFDEGATSVLTATGAFFNPNLAREAAESKGLEDVGHQPDQEELSRAHERVLDVLSRHELLEDVQIAGMARVTPGTVAGVISDLINQGRVRSVKSAESLKYAIVRG